MKNSDPPSLALCPDAPVLAGAESPATAAAGAWAASKDEWFTPWRFAALLFLLIFAAYPDVVLGANTFFYRDYGFFGYPLAHYHREAFWQGELPFWNSLSNCGLPHLAQWNTMTLYPLSLIYLLLPMPWSLGYFCLGHLLLGGTGMYWLAHRWTGNRFAATIAGLGYALNGLTLHSLMWPNNIAALAWMPFVVLFAERGVREGGRKLVLAAFIGGVQMLSGAPEIILFTWLLAAALCLTARETPLRARCGRFALTGLLVAMLAAAQLLPFLDLVLHSQRDQSYATNTWSMPAWGWANLLVPLFHCTPSVVGVYTQDAQQWTSSYYAGIGVTALALLGALWWRDRRSLVLGVAALLALLFALGSAGGIHWLLKKVLPLLGMVRFPIKFVVVAIFALPLLAAMAVARWQGAPECASTGRRWVWICGLLVALVAVIVTASRLHPVPGEHWEVTAQSGLTRAALLCAVALLVLRLQRAGGMRGLWVRLGLVAVLGLDALTHMPRQNPTVEVDALAANAIQRDAKLTDGARAMVSPQALEFFGGAATTNTAEFCLGNRLALVPNWNLVEGIASAGGFYSLYTAPQFELRSLWASRTNVSPALADVLGVRWISSETNLFALQERPTAPRVVTAGQRPVFADRDETLRALAFSTFDPAKEVLLEREANGHVQVTNSAHARVLAIRQKAGTLEADVESDAPTLVTIAQADYPGWSAVVNDRPVRLWRANHAFQAVEIPAGSSRVRLAYRERTFGAGAALSLVAFLACAVLWWRWGMHRAEEPSRAISP